MVCSIILAVQSELDGQSLIFDCNFDRPRTKNTEKVCNMTFFIENPLKNLSEIRETLDVFSISNYTITLTDLSSIGIGKGKNLYIKLR